MIPLTDSPYTDYMVLTFNKDGLFKEALNILHVTDDSYIAVKAPLTETSMTTPRIWERFCKKAGIS